MNEVAEPRVDLPVPALPVEYPVMADGRLQMVLLAVGRELAAQIVRGESLTDGTDIIAFAFDR